MDKRFPICGKANPAHCGHGGIHAKAACSIPAEKTRENELPSLCPQNGGLPVIASSDGNGGTKRHLENIGTPPKTVEMPRDGTCLANRANNNFSAEGRRLADAAEFCKRKRRGCPFWQLAFPGRFWILSPGDELRSLAPVILRAIGQDGGPAVVGPMVDSQNCERFLRRADCGNGGLPGGGPRLLMGLAAKRRATAPCTVRLDALMSI